MLWRIEYVLSSGVLIPSPIWGFQTRAFPDFKVEKVLVPPNAFSGLTFEVSWIVRNIGKVGNALVTWYDSVYIGKSTDFRSARFVWKILIVAMFIGKKEVYQINKIGLKISTGGRHTSWLFTRIIEQLNSVY